MKNLNDDKKEKNVIGDKLDDENKEFKVECKWGNKCKFNKAGICKFYHNKDDNKQNSPILMYKYPECPQICWFGDECRSTFCQYMHPHNMGYNIHQYFQYNPYQHMLVLGECDFSFSRALITKRGNNAANLYCTTFKNNDDLNSMFMENIHFCNSHGATIIHNIDATALAFKFTEPFYGFERIIFTFPRKCIMKEEEASYNKENETFIFDILKSAKKYLNKNGQIHIMLLKGQFYCWNIRNVLDRLGLKIDHWVEMNLGELNMQFNEYVPRDQFGKKFMAKDWRINFFSFKKMINSDAQYYWNQGSIAN